MGTGGGNGDGSRVQVQGAARHLFMRDGGGPAACALRLNGALTLWRKGRLPRGVHCDRGGGCAALYFLNSPSFREPYASRSGGRCVGLCPSWPGCLGGGCAAATWPDTFKVFRGIKPCVSSPSQSLRACTRASHSLFIPRNLDAPALMSRSQAPRTTNSGSTVQRAPGPPRSQQTFMAGLGI